MSSGGLGQPRRGGGLPRGGHLARAFQIESRAIDLDTLGGLVVNSNAGRSTIAFGDIEHLG
jgi:hypothetical protein